MWSGLLLHFNLSSSVGEDDGDLDVVQAARDAVRALSALKYFPIGIS